MRYQHSALRCYNVHWTLQQADMIRCVKNSCAQLPLLLNPLGLLQKCFLVLKSVGCVGCDECRPKRPGESASSVIVRLLAYRRGTPGDELRSSWRQCSEYDCRLAQLLLKKRLQTTQKYAKVIAMRISDIAKSTNSRRADDEFMKGFPPSSQVHATTADRTQP